MGAQRRGGRPRGDREDREREHVKARIPGPRQRVDVDVEERDLAADRTEQAHQHPAARSLSPRHGDHEHDRYCEQQEAGDAELELRAVEELAESLEGEDLRPRGELERAPDPHRRAELVIDEERQRGEERVERVAGPRLRGARDRRDTGEQDPRQYEDRRLLECGGDADHQRREPRPVAQVAQCELGTATITRTIDHGSRSTDAVQ